MYFIHPLVLGEETSRDFSSLELKLSFEIARNTPFRSSSDVHIISHLRPAFSEKSCPYTCARTRHSPAPPNTISKSLSKTVSST